MWVDRALYLLMLQSHSRTRTYTHRHTHARDDITSQCVVDPALPHSFPSDHLSLSLLLRSLDCVGARQFSPATKYATDCAQIILNFSKYFESTRPVAACKSHACWRPARASADQTHLQLHTLVTQTLDGAPYARACYHKAKCEVFHRHFEISSC